MQKKLVLGAGVFVFLLGAAFVPVGGGQARALPGAKRPQRLDLSAFPAARPERSLRLLFIHHSCGGQLFAMPGPESELANCILERHPNGGAARAELERSGYEVHEASYGSEIGDKTDLFDWLPKFQDKMDKVLTVDRNDTYLPPGKKHDVVVFKSCYPNNRFVGPGEGEGSPAGPELTVANAKATMRALLPLFQKQKDTLFVYVTAPPNAGKVDPEPAVKVALRKALGKPGAKEVLERQGALARDFNGWVASTDGWLAGYPEKNVVVFDYYDILTNDGESNHSAYATGDGTDNHPSAQGNQRAAQAFTPFLNRAVRRMGLAREVTGAL